jgi:hypothetical protein
MVNVRLAQDWTDGTGTAHSAGELIEVDAATLAELEASGVVGGGEWAGPTGGSGGSGDWAGPTGGGTGSAEWAGPTGGSGGTDWAGPTGGGND